MKNQINLCYHPTAVVLIDDNQNFIRTMELHLKKTWYCYTFIDPLKSLDFFEEQDVRQPFIQRCFIDSQEEKADHLFFKVNLRLIHQEVMYSNRFKEIAVVVIDYTMPGIDGIELSQKLRALHPAVHIVLLTGEADYALAIQAFNAGIIDKFIKKSTPELVNVLSDCINNLEQRYFYSLSQVILDKFSSSLNTLDRLANPTVTDKFKKICDELRIIEYYLMDSTGSYLLLNEKGIPSWFVLLNNHELMEFYEYAKTEKAPQTVINSLKNKQKIPFFYSDEDLRTPPAYWEEFLHNAIALDNNNYYYALIHDNNIYKWPADKITSYQQYLASNR